MKKIGFFSLILLIVILLNNIFVWGFGFITMRESQKALESGTFIEILVNQNNKIEYSDYKVRNWSTSEIDSKKNNEIMALLCDSECKKLNPISSSIICYFQNSNNSIAEIVLRYVDGKELSLPLKKDSLKKTIASLYSGEIVKLFGDFYLIGYFVDGVNIDDLFTVAVYKLDSTNNLEALYEYKTDNDLYEKSFPEYLSYYMNEPIYVGIWCFSMLAESMLIFTFGVLIRSRTRDSRTRTNQGKTGDGDQSGDGSKPLKK